MPKNSPAVTKRQNTRGSNKPTMLHKIVSIAAAGMASAMRTIPLVIFLLAAFVFYRIDYLPAYLVAAIPAISYIILLFGLGISGCLGRSRTFFILLMLLLSQWGMAAFAPAHVGKSFALREIHALSSLLLPLNFAFFASVSERGILSSGGRRYLVLIALQAAVVLEMVWSGDQGFLPDLDKPFVNLSSLLQTPIPAMALIAFLLAGIFLFAKRRRVNARFRVTAFCGLLAVAAGHHLYRLYFAVPFFYAAAALVMIVSLIEEYYVKAYLDELTELPSRRSLNEMMQQLDDRYVIAMLDVDFFKKFNDTYGHDAGDDVLRLIAGVLKNFTGGKAFRYGGEEFTILFPGKTLPEVLGLLEELRQEIAKLRFVVLGSGKTGELNLNVTVSIGAAEATIKLQGPDAVIKAADQALYRAKESGRNCVSK